MTQPLECELVGCRKAEPGQYACEVRVKIRSEILEPQPERLDSDRLEERVPTELRFANG